MEKEMIISLDQVDFKRLINGEVLNFVPNIKISFHEIDFDNIVKVIKAIKECREYLNSVL